MISNTLRSLISKEVGPVSRIDPLSNKNNEVFVVETKRDSFILKIYKEKGLHKDIELYVRKVIGDEDFIRKLILFDDSKKIVNEDFALFRHYKGRTLLDIINEKRLDEHNLDKIGEQIANLLLLITKHSVAGCGFIDSEGRTSHGDWISFLLDYQTPTVRSLLKANFDKNICHRIYDLIISYHEQLNFDSYSLCPIDLNMDNFLVTDSDKVVFLDVGGMISGSLKLSLGEFSGHTFGTPLHDVVWKFFDFSDQDLKQIHLYAAMMNLNVLAFIAKNNLGDLYRVRPWGNERTFVELINKHMRLANNL